jgi:N-acyl-D-aspartate/D-glutamate deacylase
MDEINRDNVLVTGQAAARNQGSLQSLRSKYHPLAGHRTFVTELADLPFPQMIAQMRTDETRRKILAERSFFDDKPFARVIFNPANLYPLLDAAGVPRYERRSTDSFEGLAAAAGVDPIELIYDALVNDEVLWAPLTGSASEDRLLDRLTHPHVRVGLGDGGAHLGIFQEAGCPTYLLSHYARDRTLGRKLSVEEAVKLQTHDTAGVVGLKDRGTLAVGLRADINVIDMAALRLHEPKVQLASQSWHNICILPL